MYEFIDKDRFDVQEVYWDFVESNDTDIYKGIKKLKSMIKKDPNFFDAYTSLSDLHLVNENPEEMYKVLKDGYNRAMKLIVKKGKFPDELSWMYMENRHIIRMIFQYAMLIWEIGEKDEALHIFQQLLGSNHNDNIGARYAIVALLEGLSSMQAYEDKFMSKDGYMDAREVEEWFNKASKKHMDEIGWWFELEDE